MIMGSTTGDLRNNLSKLLRQIRRMKMELNTDLNGLVQGSPTAFLPIIHHSLMNYSLPLARWLDEEGYEMFGKNDLRFIESLYKVLRDVFHYVPVLTREQFLATGFAERKMIMTADILKFCESKHQKLAQKSSHKRVIRKKGPVHIHQEVLTVHASCGLPNVCSEQFLTDTKVEEDTGGEDVRVTSCMKSKDAFQLQLPMSTNRRCLEAHYSGTTSLPLLTNRSPVACNVVKHKGMLVDSEMESVTVLNSHANVATPSDVPSMTIVPYSSPSPSSWCSLPSVDNSSTHSSATPNSRSGDTTPNPGSCDGSPAHNHLQKEQITNPSPLLTGKVEQLTELVEKMSAKILLLETRLQLMEGSTQQQDKLLASSENIPPSLPPPQDDNLVRLSYSQSETVTAPVQQPSPPSVLQQLSLQTMQHRTPLLYRADSPETKQLIESLRNRAKQTKQLLAAATNDY